MKLNFTIITGIVALLLLPSLSSASPTTVCPCPLVPGKPQHVCGVDGITYVSQCEANCAHVRVTYKGDCKPRTTHHTTPAVRHTIPPVVCHCSRLPVHPQPVCGVNGITYDSDCAATCAGVKVAHKGACRHTTIPEHHTTSKGHHVTVQAHHTTPHSCICPDIVAPVCGTDGKTYINSCRANCAGVRVAHNGECNTKTTTRHVTTTPHSCICYELYRPVCGTDRKTYVNDCFAKCAGVRVAYEGECKTTTTHHVTTTPHSCICYELYRPVCGTDGKTYVNDCFAKCAGVKVAYKGECRPMTTMMMTTVRRSCFCYDLFRPVCGTDGKTYQNSCFALCAGVKIAYRGRCKPKVTTAPPPCICIELYKPVCGTDGRTYSNACFARCSHVTVAYEGQCHVTTTRHLCFCNDLYEPVCGVDGKTYTNKSCAECDNVKVAHKGPCVAMTTQKAKVTTAAKKTG